MYRKERYRKRGEMQEERKNREKIILSHILNKHVVHEYPVSLEDITYKIVFRINKVVALHTKEKDGGLQEQVPDK